MPSVGTGSIDVRGILNSIAGLVKSRANAICTAPCDGAVLKMHYRWTFFILIGSFFTVWYSWFNREVITCVSHFNAETQVRLDYINVCLSYPYVEVVDEITKETSKRYLLFYRWVQWSFLFMAAIYYIPRKLSKNMENPKCKRLIEELASHSSKYDDNTEHILLEKVTLYMTTNLRTHNGLYVKFFFLNIVALVIDIFAMHYFDFLLQSKFLRYGYDAYPFERDPELFQDYMSQMFPPFALCKLDKPNQIVNEREETFGCHLTIMELYEKVFLLLWIWLIILITTTSMYIVFMLIAMIPKVREFWLRTSKPVHATEKANLVIAKANGNCKIGDIYFLYRIKGHMSHARFYNLLLRLGDPKLSIKSKAAADELDSQTNLDPKSPGGGGPNKQMPPMNHMGQNPMMNHPQQQGQHPDARNRKPQPQSISPPMNPDYLNQLYSNPETMARHGQVNDMAQRTPLLSKNNANTSILIE